MIEKDLAEILKPGDEVTTTLGRIFVVGSIHPDENWAGQFWIEPRGAHDFDWWIPVSKIVRLNGRDVQSNNDTNSSKTQI